MSCLNNGNKLNHQNNILEVSHLKMYFDVTKGLFAQREIVKAVDDVNLTIKEGETHGLVGESGCGKTTLGRTIVRIYDPTAGKIIYKGLDIAKLDKRELFDVRKDIQMIFQDPYASLNPRLTVGEIIREPMDIHKIGSKRNREEKVYELLEKVGLKPDHIRRFPHEFSGGQRQRIGIARTLALDPSLIICDEPISALDVSIQAQIINLLETLCDEMGLSYLFIAHDLSMVNHISQRISVMYLGHIVETGLASDVYRAPMHPYTRALISAIPIPDPDKALYSKRVRLKGEIPSPINPQPGCPFKSRCDQCMAICKQQMPPLTMHNNRMVACFLYQ